MSLIGKAKQEAEKNGKRLDPNIVKGLQAVQNMHDMCKKSNGSIGRGFSLRKEK